MEDRGDGRETLVKETLQKDEEEMRDEICLPHQTFAWQQKYTPQKPVYFNKIRSGYDWNQYNQTHYDEKNPPPKPLQEIRQARRTSRPHP